MKQAKLSMKTAINLLLCLATTNFSLQILRQQSKWATTTINNSQYLSPNRKAMRSQNESIKMIDFVYTQWNHHIIVLNTLWVTLIFFLLSKGLISSRATFEPSKLFDSCPISECLANRPSSSLSCDCPPLSCYRSCLERANSHRKSPFSRKFATEIYYSLIFRLRCFYIERIVLQKPIFTLGEGKFLVAVNLKQMLVFGKFQNKFESLTHTVLDQFFLGLFQFFELLNQLQHHPILSQRPQLSPKNCSYFLNGLVRVLDQIADHFSSYKESYWSCYIFAGSSSGIIFAIDGSIALSSYFPLQMISNS